MRWEPRSTRPTASSSLRPRFAADGRPAAGRACACRAGDLDGQVDRLGADPAHVPAAVLTTTTGATRGVVEIDQSYGPIADAARNSALLVAAILEGLLLLLIVLLVPVLSGATARLRDHLEELDTIASHDELTGLLNRPGFRRACEQALAIPAAAGALLVVDLERFSEINETIGAENGDRLLGEVAGRLRGVFPDRSVARIGEDEFGVLLTGLDRARLAELVDEVRAALKAPFFVDGIEIELDARCGAAEHPEHGDDFDALIRHAGLALSRAKAVHEPLAVYVPDPSDGDLARLRLKGGFATPSKPTSCSSTTSRRPTSRRGRSAESRHSSAGSTRRAVCSRPESSSRRQSRAG